MRNFMIGALMACSMALPANAATTQCRDAHGHFTKCPTAAPAAATHPAAPAAGITRDRNGRCHGAGGRFVRCPAAAAH
jgi:hypothetical protein